MNPDKANGVLTFMRILTPFGVAISVVLISYILNDVRDVKKNVESHLSQEISELNARVGKMETSISYITRMLWGVNFKNGVD